MTWRSGLGVACGRSRRAGPVIGLSVAAAFLVGPSPVVYAASFAPIGPAGSDPDHQIVLWGLSGDGRVAVGQRNCLRECDAELVFEAIRWTEEGGIEQLGLLPGGIAESAAIAASGDGSQLVGYSDSADGFSAFRWQGETGLESIDPGPLPGLEWSFSVALGTSADGSVVVGYREVAREQRWIDEPPVTIHEPFVWTRESGMQGLPVPDRRGLHSGAYDVSDDGRIVVGRVETSRGVEAFAWDDVRGLQPLGGFEASEDATNASVFTQASAISADGTTIVGSSLRELAGTHAIAAEPFRFTREAGMQRLGDAGERWAFSQATDVSGDGAIVVGTGQVGLLDSEGEAFVWDADRGIRPLRDVLESLGLALPGWRLTSAQAISRDGSTIVGTARDPNGRFRSYVAVIPEPGPAALLGLGLLALGRRRSESPPGTRRGR